MPKALLDRFDEVVSSVRAVLASLVPAEDVQLLLEQTRECFASMERELPYADRPEHSMFPSAFSVFVYLAIFRVLRPRGFDAHEVGAAIHAAPLIDFLPSTTGESTLAEDSAASMMDAAPNEFVFEMVAPSGHEGGGVNIRRCAVCHAFGRYDAMELVPYMCALDDVVRANQDNGLRRTGTIGLGATHCDFRYRGKGNTLRLVDQYPDQIRLPAAQDANEASQTSAVRGHPTKS